MAKSLPSRERGLKFIDDESNIIGVDVAPLAGAWIEILNVCFQNLSYPSLPSRERGLKSESLFDKLTPDEVAPLAGAWIEIYHVLLRISNRRSRSPRGSVD